MENGIEGVGQKLGGEVKQGLGDALNDRSLETSGVADQMVGTAKQMAGTAADAISNPGPIVEKAKQFAKDRPWAAAALVGTIALALLNTLRGKR